MDQISSRVLFVAQPLARRGVSPARSDNVQAPKSRLTIPNTVIPIPMVSSRSSISRNSGIYVDSYLPEDCQNTEPVNVLNCDSESLTQYLQWHGESESSLPLEEHRLPSWAGHVCPSRQLRRHLSCLPFLLLRRVSSRAPSFASCCCHWP